MLWKTAVCLDVKSERNILYAEEATFYSSDGNDKCAAKA
jgi:hypothetical protein